MEQWHKVPGFDYLEVTREGRVRTAEKVSMKLTRWGTKHKYRFKARELTPRIGDNGYWRVAHQRDKKRGPLYVHRLVALTFVAGHEIGYHVNHINGNKLDNRPDNLEWVPIDANVRHAWRTGLCKTRGVLAPGAKLTPARVRAIRRMIALEVPDNTIAIGCDLSPNTIWKIRKGLTWQSVADGVHG